MKSNNPNTFLTSNIYKIDVNSSPIGIIKTYFKEKTKEQRKLKQPISNFNHKSLKKSRMTSPPQPKSNINDSLKAPSRYSKKISIVNSKRTFRTPLSSLQNSLNSLSVLPTNKSYIEFLSHELSNFRRQLDRSFFRLKPDPKLSSFFKNLAKTPSNSIKSIQKTSKRLKRYKFKDYKLN